MSKQELRVRWEPLRLFAAPLISQNSLKVYNLVLMQVLLFFNATELENYM